VALTFYLGPPGALVALPPPLRDIARPLVRRQGEFAALSGATVVDRYGRGRRRHSLAWQFLTPDEAGVLERLWQLPGTLILDDPSRRNRLTANQSTGSDVGRDATGVLARGQGSVSSSTVLARSAPRSFAWATGAAVGATGRGLVLASSITVPDFTWHPVRPSGVYTVSLWARATAAITMRAGLEWYDAASPTPAPVGSPAVGTAAAVGTGAFSKFTVTGTAPAGSAYGLVTFLNTVTTGAGLTLYVDDLQAEEAAADSAWLPGSGLPRVATAGELPETTPLVGYEHVELALLEV
jgi:hypothetical protein